MTLNIGTLDRGLRVAGGLALMGLAYAGTIPSWLGWVGVIPFATGLVGFCPLYRVLGIGTRAAQ